MNASNRGPQVTAHFADQDAATAALDGLRAAGVTPDDVALTVGDPEGQNASVRLTVQAADASAAAQLRDLLGAAGASEVYWADPAQIPLPSAGAATPPAAIVLPDGAAATTVANIVEDPAAEPDAGSEPEPAHATWGGEAVGGAAGALLGGVIGALLGGPLGAAIGVAVGGGAGSGAVHLVTEPNTGPRGSEIGAGAGALVGGIMGAPGGPIGMAIGATLGGALGGASGEMVQDATEEIIEEHHLAEEAVQEEAQEAALAAAAAGATSALPPRDLPPTTLTVAPPEGATLTDPSPYRGAGEAARQATAAALAPAAEAAARNLPATAAAIDRGPDGTASEYRSGGEGPRGGDPMTNNERDTRQPAPDTTDHNPHDAGAAPGVSNAGSTGRAFGTSMMGAGTGTSIGPSRGNTGPGTGSDALEASYGAKPPTDLSQMAGLSNDTDEGGNATQPNDPAFQQATRAVDPAATRAAAATPDSADTLTSTAGTGDNDIPAETKR